MLSPESTYPYEVGKIYNRRLDVDERFGGQRQGGISTPQRAPFVFLFTGESGEQYGYSDGWTEDGVFLYTGEGQIGPMEFVRGNRAIRDHSANGRDLLIFEKLRDARGYRFLGAFACAGYEFREAPDRDRSFPSCASNVAANRRYGANCLRTADGSNSRRGEPELPSVHNPLLRRAPCGLVALAGDVAIDGRGATQGGRGAACS